MASSLSLLDEVGTTAVGVTVFVGAVLLYVLSSWSKPPKPPKCLDEDDPAQVVALKLVNKVNVSHNVRKFTFGLPSANMVLGLPTGMHVTVSAVMPNMEKEGKPEERMSRFYTPVSNDRVKGKVELVLKVYEANVDKGFPNGGHMSQYLDRLKIGESINFKGPLGHVKYLGNGSFLVKRKGKGWVAEKYKNVGMVAGGTGISPLYQFIKEAMETKDRTCLRLLCANSAPADVLLDAELQEFAAESGGSLEVHHTVSKATDDWKGFVGRVSEKTLVETMPPPSEDTLILCCGPKSLLDKCVRPLLEQLHYTHVFEY